MCEMLKLTAIHLKSDAQLHAQWRRKYSDQTQTTAQTRFILKYRSLRDAVAMRLSEGDACALRIDQNQRNDRFDHLKSLLQRREMSFVKASIIFGSNVGSHNHDSALMFHS